jgi:glycosyltransferase involved in cell wall biosynthesis
MNNLIIISYHFPPAGGTSAAASIRLGKFAQYLPDFGWMPFIISADNQTFDLLDESLVFASDVAVTRVRDPIGHIRGRHRISSWLPSPGLLFPWAIGAAQAASELAKRYATKLILASSPPPASFVAGYLTHKRSGLPLVLDYRDQWTLSPYRSGPSILQKWDGWLEAHILRSACMVIVSNIGRLREHEAFWGKVTPKAIVIPNGYDCSDFSDIKPDRIPSQSVESEVIIRHLGAIYGARTATTRAFLNAMNQHLLSHAEAPKVRVQFIGSVPHDVFTLKLPLSPRLVIEHQRGTLHKEALALELGADVLLLIIGRHLQTGAETSSKIFEYLATGRPILIGGDSSLLHDLTAGLDRVFWVGDEPSQRTMADFFDWLTKHGQGIPQEQACNYLRKHYGAYERATITRQLAIELKAFT